MKVKEEDEVTINSLKLDLKDWKLGEENNDVLSWYNKYGDNFMLNFFPTEPDLSNDADIHSLRHFYRDIVSQSKGAVIEVEKDRIKNLPAIRTIFKFSQESTGFTYVASYTIPRENFSFVLRFVCPEHGMTGVRESILLIVAGKDGLVKEGTLQGWFSDPYDPEFKSDVLSNIADDEKYDEKFPEHPLSRARSMLREVKDNLIVDDEIYKSNEFFLDFD